MIQGMNKIARHRTHGLLAAPLFAILGLQLAATCAQAAETLQISFSEQRPSNTKVYSSDGSDPIRELRVLNGHTVNLQTSQGRDYQLQAGGWGWTQVQEVAAHANAVSITPHLEDNSVNLDIQVYNRDTNSSNNYSTTISGKLGEWLQLLGPAQVSRGSGKTYSTGSKSSSRQPYPQGLYVKVESLSEAPPS